ncbi:MAG: right-handed parallel beta-helix repeat-containing protein [Prolixibacteraceae bacterium]|nr:right-handed parallel beta-helix repeat-containing protein [Prolixibacteraceae bacterium]
MKAKTIKFLPLLAIFLMAISTVFGQNIGLVNVKHAEQVITVGGPTADVSGYSSGAIQLALDALQVKGGGIVKLNPGTFQIIGPVRLQSNTSLIGSGKTTILKKCDGFKTSFIIDADWGMLKAVVKDASGFKIGMGIQLSDSKHNEGWDVTTALITDIQDNVIYFDNRTVNDYLASLNGTITNGCSIIEAVDVENVKIADLIIEGNKATNDYINGCRGGGIYIHKSKNCTIENVRINEFNGDTFSWQITENITVKGCEAANGGGLGFHPGTGSDHSIVENCISHHNSGDGIFLCWRVQNGIFRNNTVYSNGDNGISIGHKDTDNLFENNRVYENAHHGVLFRNENEQNSGHRNIFTNNTIENNGTERESAGFYIGGETHDITITNNTIRFAGKGNQPTAILVGKKSSKVTANDNQISGSKELVQEK